MLSFIDVSGDPYTTPDDSPYVVAAAICLKKSCLDEINQTVYRLKRDVLLNERKEIKSTDLVNASTLNNPSTNKAKFLDSIMVQCINHHDCRCLTIAFSNTGGNQKSAHDRLPRHYRDTLWKIEAGCVELHAKDTLVILDNNSRRTDKTLAFAFNNYLYRTAARSDLPHIIPVPIFADSEMTTGIQLADIVAGIVRKYYAEKLYLNEKSTDVTQYHQKLREYYAIICSRSVNRIKIGAHYIEGMSFFSSYNTQT